MALPGINHAGSGHMKRLITISLFCFVFSLTSMASHITGGEMYYTLTGVNGNVYTYSVTLKLFQRCNSGRQFPNPAIISVFDKTNLARMFDLNVQIASTENIAITNPDPCITNPPSVCYDVAYYNFVVSLPASAQGYVMASQVNFRINGINNLSPSGNIGATYTAEIPGTLALSSAPDNHSAKFTGSDLVVVCANNEFSYSFAAQDPNSSDELRYSFCEAYASTGGSGGTPEPTGPPPFPSVPYFLPQFDGSAPLGIAVQVHPTTGLITGVAPGAGFYVVTVCVEEVRNGIVIARQRKDIQINIADCDVASASLLPEYSLCKNTQTMTISNLSNSPLIVTTYWEFTDASGTILFTSTAPVTTYTFPSIGNYTIKLVINRNQSCTDSTTAIVRVFPGFVPDFSFAGICITKPTLFTDLTTSVYGTPATWSWDFGEPGTVNDISTTQHPQYTYPSLGTKNVRLIATDSRGCRDTIYKNVNIVEKPPISLKFRDTLICLNDVLMLEASGSGLFSWSPLVNILNPNTATPVVSPPVTTKYYVDLDDNGCKNRDSVTVRVVDHVTLLMMNDTTICRGDTIQLRVVSDGLQYVWAPAAQIIDPTVQNPMVFTVNTTTYQVTAIIGGCSDTKSIRVFTIPYPVANAGEDQDICYNTSTRLNGTVNGISWSWSPAAFLNDATILNPIASPPRSTDFILTTYDNKGCPKPGRDTVHIVVLPKMNVSAGADTAVVINQPLQLLATGGNTYQWSPPAYLSATQIPNPVALFNTVSEDRIQYKVVGFSMEGCKDSAYLLVKIYKTGPTVFVPTAFTPNNDGRNDVLRPIAVGMKSIEGFQVYNRWGQLVFSTRTNGHGWDGRIGGKEQNTGSFAWLVQATDYTGKAYFLKGTVTLIR